MIECSLRDLKEYHSVLPSYNSKKTKKGLYSGSNFFHIKGYGRDKWVVIVHINVDHKAYISDGMQEEGITEGCIDFLNQPPVRKKYAKKTPTPLYGHLELHRAYFKEDEHGSYIEAYLTTDQRKNKNFWSEGAAFKKRKKRKKV